MSNTTQTTKRLYEEVQEVKKRLEDIGRKEMKSMYEFDKKLSLMGQKIDTIVDQMSSSMVTQKDFADYKVEQQRINGKVKTLWGAGAAILGALGVGLLGAFLSSVLK